MKIVTKEQKQKKIREQILARKKKMLTSGVRLRPSGKRLASQPEDSEANKKIFYEALKNNVGLVLRAANATGICSMTHYYWMRTDPKYKEDVDKLIELKRDLVETKLTELVESKEPSCVTFTSRCLLRKRGYDQTTEIRNADGEKFEIDISGDIVKNTLKSIYDKADDE